MYHNHTTKRPASAKVAKKVAAAASSIVLLGSSVPAAVLPALAPSVALAASTEEVLISSTYGGVKLTYDSAKTKQVTWTFTGEKDGASHTVTIVDAYKADGYADETASSVKLDGTTAAWNDVAEYLVKDNFTSIKYDSSQVGYLFDSFQLESGTKFNVAEQYTISASDITKIDGVSSMANAKTVSFKVANKVRDIKVSLPKNSNYTVDYYDSSAEDATPISATSITLDKLDHLTVTPSAGMHFVPAKGWTVNTKASDLPGSRTLKQSDILAVVTGSEDLNLVPVMEANQVTVKFDTSNMSASDANTAKYKAISTVIDVIDNSKVPISSVSLKGATSAAAGKTLAGWEDAVTGELVFGADVDFHEVTATTLTLITDDAGEQVKFGDLSGNTPTVTTTLKARFTDAAPVAVTVATGANGTIAVTDFPKGSDWKSTSTTYAAGTALKSAVAKADDGYHFVNWTNGSGTVASDDIELTVEQMLTHLQQGYTDGKNQAVATTFTANFAADTVTITLDQGDGSVATGKELPAPISFKVTNTNGITDSYYKDVIVAPKTRTLIGFSISVFPDDVGIGDKTNGDFITLEDAAVSSKLASYFRTNGVGDGDSVTLYAIYSLEEGYSMLKISAATGGRIYKLDFGQNEVDDFRSYTEPIKTATEETEIERNVYRAKPQGGYAFDAWYVEGPKGDGTDDVKVTDSTDLKRNHIADALKGLGGKDGAITFVAKFKPYKYTLTVNNETYDYTVGEDAALPEAMATGTWVINGQEVYGKDDIDALVTKENAHLSATKKLAKLGWYKDSDGEYHYGKSYDADGNVVDAKGWSRGGTKSYYYYFDLKTGKMKKSTWVKAGGYWYHFGARGNMEHDQPITWGGRLYWLSSRGAAVAYANR